MKTTKIIFTVLFSYFLQLLPVYGDGDLLRCMDISISSASGLDEIAETYKKFREGQQRITDLENDLTAKSAKILANAITSRNDSYLKVTYKKVSKHDKQMADRIFAEAIHEIILQNNLTALPDLLWPIIQLEDSELNKIIGHIQWQAHNHISKGYHKDRNEYLQKLSLRLSRIRNGDLYANDQSLQSSVDNITNSLPNNLKLFLIKSHICLANVKYSRYVFTSVRTHLGSHRIWLWWKNHQMDSSGHIQAEFREVDSAGGKKKLKVILQGTKYKLFYAMNPKTKLVFGSQTNSNNMWDIEFFGRDRVVLSMDNFKMCAAEAVDQRKCNIRGKKGVSSTDSECQWRVIECNFKD